MTATEELRALLDERGVEWNGDSYGFCEEVTSFDVDRLDCAFSEFDKWSTMFRVWNITPVQIVEATLGRGTCKNISNPPSGFLCSECGWGDFSEPSHLLATARYTSNDGGPNYCPNCGAKVVEG